MSVCPACYMKLRDDEDCPRCAANRGQPPTTDDATSPELEYLRTFYRMCSADPKCSDCGERYEGQQGGPFDAGHWMANHWHDEHPEIYAEHKARVEGTTEVIP